MPADVGLGIVVGGRGRGSNMAAIIRACQEGVVNAEVRAVVAPKADIPAVERAHELGVPVRIVSGNDAHGLVAALADVDWVCLAGYLRLLPAEVLANHVGRVINIHPALLPKFGGQGMYGHHVHEAVIAAGEPVSGCTVHYVTEAYDEGATILQKTTAVLPDDTAESLAKRVLALEHTAYVEALVKLIDG